MPKKSNWQVMQGQDEHDTTRYRDVYEDQQLERSKIQQKQSPVSRTILAIVMTVLVAVLAWVLLSVGQMAFSSLKNMSNSGLVIGSKSSTEQTVKPAEGIQSNDYPYLAEIISPTSGLDYKVIVNPETGELGSETYDEPSQVPESAIPSWYADSKSQMSSSGKSNADGGAAVASSGPSASSTGLVYYMRPVLWKVLADLTISLVFFLMIYQVLMRNLAAQNLMSDTTDINQYQNDQHIALPEEVMRKFDFFPDAGAHSNVQVSSMISHVALSNKGINSMKLSVRADKDIVDEDGDIIYLKGEVLTDDDGNIETKTVPMFDKGFMEDLFTASGALKDKAVRKYYDATKIPYNPGNKDREKQKGYDTVADLINGDWTIPSYETTTPAGAYVVDTAPVNTMVLAITRAGKGQTVINPTIDMWTRESQPNNMVINDPKGELLQEFYVPGTYRGFQIVQFNLINPMNTDIYNPLMLAAEAARNGDFIKCQMYVANIADVFFPKDGGDDPVWANSASNAFQRAAFGLIDYYLEEETELRRFAEKTHMDGRTLETKLDELWGHVTLYNCYQFFTELTSKKLKNPAVEFTKDVKAGKYNDMKEDEYEAKVAEVERKSALWEDKPEADLLTLYFNATSVLPQNQIRTLAGNANKSLRAMAGAEKMMASVYGIAITAMSFFTDQTISTLTSGTPSQNVDLAGLSFPRRLGFRLNADFMKKYHLLGMQCEWHGYSDPLFTKEMGKDFRHEDIINRAGWARYYFKGIMPDEIMYARCEIKNPQTGQLIRTFYFKFQKMYQTSLSGRTYTKDPVLGEKIVKNGVMTELRPVKGKDGKVVYRPGHVVFNTDRIVDIDTQPRIRQVKARAITQFMLNYSEKPRMVFLVTPPHLTSYAKLILILVKQLVDLNFDQSYTTKSNQKPLYKTRYMLDELGNLQSDGQGISGFQTMLSIGLGQSQEFTLILQTLQQLRDVYGDSVDKIVQGNAQPLDSLIATPDGWKQMGDIKVGDEVLTPYGTVTTVTGVYPKGVRPVYRVVLRDGSTAECCNQHLWYIERYKTALVYKGADENGRKIYDRPENGKTCELFREVIDTDELKRRVDRGRQINLPKIEPVVYAEANLPLHPYVLGVILGDGQVDRKGHVTITVDEKDNETLDRIRLLGYELNQCNRTAKGKTPVYYLKGVTEIMRDFGLAGHRSWEKFIPDQYIYASVEQRVELLRGIMDTDGTISKKGEMEFTSSSHELAEGVQTIVRSLGGRVNINVKDKVYCTSPNQKTKKKARPAYRVQNIRLFDINPFHLTRKAERWVKRTGNSGNRVVSVEYVRDEEVQCIKVADERHLYITDDYMPTHNTSNIVFLKSTDDSMLDTLQKMSGTTHKVFTNSKTITRDTEAVFQNISGNEGKVSYTMTAQEIPVISYNDMAFISERNSIVFRAGDSPIWNRNETILPMDWRLKQNNIKQPGKEYTFQTIPTLSSAKEFDVRQNQPNFDEMLKKRMTQAMEVDSAKEVYMSVHGYTSDYDIAKLDPDIYAASIMEVINMTLHAKDDESVAEYNSYLEDEESLYDQAETNEDVVDETVKRMNEAKENSQKVFAGGYLSVNDLIGGGTSGIFGVNRGLESDIIAAYVETRGAFAQDHDNFAMKDGNLYSVDGTLFIENGKMSADGAAAGDMADKMNSMAKSRNSRVFSDYDISENDVKKLGSYHVTDDFYRFLAEQVGGWRFANGRFETEMARLMRDK